MVSPGNSNWLVECSLIEDLAIPTENEFLWMPQAFNDAMSKSSDALIGSFIETDAFKKQGSHKRARPESSTQLGSKACREKIRRDKLNGKFLELGTILEPGKPPKIDKVAILKDATRLVNRLRSEAQKLKELNESLQEKIKELKAEKNELRDEKQRMRAEKVGLEQQIQLLIARTSYIPHAPVVPTAFAVQGNNKNPGQKLMMPFISYSGFPMWQFMQPSDVDTSQDAQSRPPVA